VITEKKFTISLHNQSEQRVVRVTEFLWNPKGGEGNLIFVKHQRGKGNAAQINRLPPGVEARTRFLKKFPHDSNPLSSARCNSVLLPRARNIDATIKSGEEAGCGHSSISLEVRVQQKKITDAKKQRQVVKGIPEKPFEHCQNEDPRTRKRIRKQKEDEQWEKHGERDQLIKSIRKSRIRWGLPGGGYAQQWGP